MAVRVLCTGDIHIGRRTSKVTDGYRTATAWTTLVAIAISEGVDVLAVSGDIIDKENKSYESIGPLQDGLRQLNTAGIDTVAITGNHDYDVLPRVAESTGTERFHLLGKGGSWERITLSRPAGALHVVGWSFPREHVQENPLHSYQDLPDDGIPVLGLLHADIGVTHSQYAPVSLDDLWARRVDFWLLGHIHVPRLYANASGGTALYPGSPYAMDPGETGVHGIWMKTFESGRSITPLQIAIAPIRYVATEIDMSEVTDEASFQAAISTRLLSVGGTLAEDQSATYLKTVSCRIRLVGACTAHHAVASWADRARQEMHPFPVGSVSVLIDEIITDVRPPIDLEALARSNDPVGETARLLIALQSPHVDSPYADLIKQTTAEMCAVHRHSGYSALRASADLHMRDEPTEETARDLLVAQGWRFLSALLTQKEQ